jgi:hypothetical protein
MLMEQMLKKDKMFIEIEAKWMKTSKNMNILNKALIHYK